MTRSACLAGAILIGSLGACSIFNPQPPAYNSIEVVRDRLDSAAFEAADMPEYNRPLRRILMYLPNRLLDCLDLVSVSLGAGPGEGLEVYVTRGLQMSYVNYRTWRLGLLGRSGGIYEEGHYDEWHLSKWHGTESASGRRPIWATSNLRPFEEPLRDGVPAVRRIPDGIWDLGGQAHLFLGARGMVHPYEIFDLIVGLWGDDPAGDDYGVRDYPLHEVQPQGEVVQIFVQALDAFNEADLRTVLSHRLAERTWIYRDGKLARLVAGGTDPGPTPGTTDAGRDYLIVGDSRFEPAWYRDPDSGRMELAIECIEARLRWGVPAEFVYRVSLYNRVLRRAEEYRIHLRIEESHWRILRLREIPPGA